MPGQVTSCATVQIAEQYSANGHGLHSNLTAAALGGSQLAVIADVILASLPLCTTMWSKQTAQITTTAIIYGSQSRNVTLCLDCRVVIVSLIDQSNSYAARG